MNTKGTRNRIPFFISGYPNLSQTAPNLAQCTYFEEASIFYF